MALHNETGKLGEMLAIEYLIGKGYAIVDRNVRVGKKELDIVAMSGERIVFVEVKTRTNSDDDPLEAIDSKKVRLITAAAETYVRTHEIRHEVQFDVIIVRIESDGTSEIIHYPDAFLAPLKSYR